jgi:3',5'-cyclic AMP phosphodiesterase CpdA
MRTLVHLSDIHFGRIDHATISPLIETVNRVRPDLVAVSGDLTQRARTSEFRDAKAFLDALPKPLIVVPGNHDVPLGNLYARFVQKLDKYRRYITPDLEPAYADDEIAVVGLNTARSATWKNGRVSRGQIARVQHRLCAVGEGIVKVVVTHHPFELPDGFANHSLVGRAHAAMNGLAACGADLFLAGHLHLGFTADTAVRYGIAGHAALVIQAGTATSTRGRGETNSFNVIRIAYPEVAVERFSWNALDGRFAGEAPQWFRRRGRSWITAAGSSIAAPPSV